MAINNKNVLNKNAKINLIIYRNCNWTFILIICLIIALISGLRVFGIDRDFYDYLKYFNTLAGLEPEETFRFKIGFELFTKLILTLSKNFNFYLFSIAFFSILPKIFLIAKHSRNLIISNFIYLFLIFPLHEMTQIRASFAYAIFYLGIYFFNNSKNLLGLLLLIFSLSLHWACFGLAILFFSFKLFITKNHSLVRKIFSLSIIFLILYYLSLKGLNLVPSGFGKLYFTDDSDANIFSLRIFGLLLINLIGFRFQNLLPDNAKSWQTISLFGILVFYSMSNVKTISFRVLEASYLSYLLWIDYLPKNARFLTKTLLTLIAIISLYLYSTRGYFMRI